MTTAQRVAKILSDLKKQGTARNRQGMARFGINVDTAFGVSVTWLRKYAKQYGKDHDLALALWKTGKHEAMILSALIDELDKVTPSQMDNMVKKFNSWDICDLCCANLFDKTPCAFTKALLWSKSNTEFTRRAGFALMACLAWHDKQAVNEKFMPFLKEIARYSHDDRNFVRKAVNWALRQIGKRNIKLNKLAIEKAEIIQDSPHKSAQWIAKDALRELTNPKTKQRILKYSSNY